jgi:protein PhnA
MTDLPKCPSCGSSFTYEAGSLLACPECGHEWSPDNDDPPEDERPTHRDAVGNILSDGDSVTIVKDLKVKGASSALKAGTKVRGIRLVDEDHNIDCKIEGFGPMKLKSEFVKKA